MLQQEEKPVSTLILDIEYPEIAGWRGIDENKHVPNVGRVGRPDASSRQRRSVLHSSSILTSSTPPFVPFSLHNHLACLSTNFSDPFNLIKGW